MADEQGHEAGNSNGRRPSGDLAGSIRRPDQPRLANNSTGSLVERHASTQRLDAGTPLPPEAPGKAGAAWRRIVKRPEIATAAPAPAPALEPARESGAPGYAMPTHRPDLSAAPAAQTRTAPADAHICPACDAANSANTATCWRCQAQLTRPTAAPVATPASKKATTSKLAKICAFCGTANRPEDLFCQRCRQALPVGGDYRNKTGRQISRRAVLLLGAVLLLLVALSAFLVLRGGAAQPQVAATVPLVAGAATAVPTEAPVDSTATAQAAVAAATVAAVSTAEAAYAGGVQSLLGGLDTADKSVQETMDGLSATGADYAAATQKIKEASGLGDDVARRLSRTLVPATQRAARSAIDNALQVRAAALNNAGDHLDAISKYTAGADPLKQAKDAYDKAQATFDQTKKGYGDVVQTQNAYDDLQNKLGRLKTRADQSLKQFNVAWQDYTTALAAAKDLLTATPTPAVPTTVPTAPPAP